MPVCMGLNGDYNELYAGSVGSERGGQCSSCVVMVEATDMHTVHLDYLEPRLRRGRERACVCARENLWVRYIYIYRERERVCVCVSVCEESKRGEREQGGEEREQEGGERARGGRERWTAIPT